MIDKPDEDNQQVKQHKNTLNQIGQQIAEQMEELKYESEGIMDEEMLQTWHILAWTQTNIVNIDFLRGGILFIY